MRGSVMRGGVMLGGVMRSQRGEIYLLKDGVPQPPTTFSRASTGTYWDANGVLQTAAVDELRLTHDPANGELQGLLIESQRTNSLLWNRDLSQAVWLGSAGVAQDQVGIDGAANTAWTVTDSTSGDTSRRYQSVSVDNDSAVHTAFAFVKKTTGASSFPALGVDLSGGTSVLQRYVINTDTGSAVPMSVSTGVGAAKVIDYGDWWKVVVSAINNSTGNSTLTFLLWPAINSDASGSPSASVTGSVIYDFGQVELNTNLSLHETFPIETDASAKTRSRDIATVENLDFVNLNEGTFVAEFYPRPESEAIFGRVLSSSDGPSVLQLNDGDKITSFNGTTNLSTTNSYTPGARTLAAFRYSGSQRSVVLNAGPIATDGAGLGTIFAAGLLSVGYGPSGTLRPLNSPIKNVYYIPRALSDGELQAVTAL